MMKHLISLRITDEQKDKLDKMMEKYDVSNQSDMIRMIIENYEEGEEIKKLEKIKELAIEQMKILIK